MPEFSAPHPKAMEAMNAKAEALLAQITELPASVRQDDPFPTERPVETIPNEHIIGDPQVFDTDISGNYTGRYFFVGNNRLGLNGEAHIQLRKLADQVLKANSLRRKVSKRWTEQTIFDWCRTQFTNPALPAFSQYLLTRIDEETEDLIVWTPIAHLEVQSEFQFGPVTIAPITKQIFDELRGAPLEESNPQAAQVEMLFSDLREKFLGGAASILKITAEKERAYEIALEYADVSTTLLRFFSRAARTPWLSCPCAPYGSEFVRSAHGFSIGSKGSRLIREHLRDMRARPWRISNVEIQHLINNGMHRVSRLAEDSKLSDFQLKLRTSLLTYCRGVGLSDLNDRLVQTLSALEGLFLRNTSEPIQQNLGERIAFFLATSSEERREIVEAIRAAYDMRSKYVHHMISMAEEDALGEFIAIAWKALAAAINAMERFNTTQEFVADIERVKFGGS